MKVYEIQSSFIKYNENDLLSVFKASEVWPTSYVGVT